MLKKFLSEIEDGLTPNTWWTHQECGSNKEASIALKELFEGKAVFETPKPVKLLRRIIQLFAEEDSLIVDFFGGSGTTGHAVFEANHEDGGRRRFLLVQLQEKTDLTEYSTIAGIGRARLKKVIEGFENENAESLHFGEPQMKQDLGFKAFKLSSPNIQQWPADEEADPEGYTQKLSLFNDPLVAGWKPESVIWEVSLREGFSLNMRFCAKDLPNGNKVYEVNDADTGQRFLICLDEQIRTDFPKHCELTLDTLLVCRDVALDDSAAANLALQCRLKTI